MVIADFIRYPIILYISKDSHMAQHHNKHVIRSYVLKLCDKQIFLA